VVKHSVLALQFYIDFINFMIVTLQLLFVDILNRGNLII